MSKDLSKEEQKELELKAYVDAYFKQMDEDICLSGQKKKERERAAKEAEKARAAERKAVNRQESEAS